MLQYFKKKNFVILFLIFSFLLIIVLDKHENSQKVIEIASPNKIILESGKVYTLNEYKTFDDNYTDNNKYLAQNMHITEDEAFILGNFGKYWAKNILQNRYIKIKNDNLVYYKFGYKTKFENSPYCIKDGKILNQAAFKKQLNTIRKGKFVLVDIDSDNIYPISKKNAQNLKNFVVIRKSHVKYNNTYKESSSKNKPQSDKLYFKPIFDDGNIKIIVSDSTSKLTPDRNCSSDVCKEILKNINNTKESLDIAIYGYSSTPAIENAIKSAILRGVNVRLIYDIDSKGQNIYPDTEEIAKLIPNNKTDKNSKEVGNTMHNKFYIFDNKIVITGSANLSHTDMSGYNSNSIIIIKSQKAAEIYTKEFEQMFTGKFHNTKISNPDKSFDNIKIYFSPQDKAIRNGVLPLIKNAHKYIYIPSFIITENNITEELIKAHSRGVDIKIIVDALNASTKHSKHKELRNTGIQVKAENYAGKMHSKTMIIDDEYLIIGSMNFSYSGENRNDENMVILKNAQAAKFYKEFFLYQWAKIPEKWLKYTPRAEGKDSIGSCYDGIDNNYDGLTDFDDPACKQ